MSSTSIFAYPLTRRYPAKFTWIILGCGTLLVAILTFFAVAGNAYQSEVIYTPDPNATVASTRWFQNRPFTWTSDLETTCQPALLSTILQRFRGRFHDNVWEARATKFGRRGRFHDKLGAEVMKSSGRISLKLEQTLFQVHFTRQILISDHEKVMVQRYRKLKIWAFWLEVPARKLRVRVSGHNCSPAR